MAMADQVGAKYVMAKANKAKKRQSGFYNLLNQVYSFINLLFSAVKSQPCYLSQYIYN